MSRTDEAARPSSVWGRRPYHALLGWMILSYTLGALTKFYWGATWFGAPYSVKFEEWGYPSWFRFVVGASELGAAALLVRRPTRPIAAGLLLVIMLGAVATHLVNNDPFAHSVSAYLHLVLSAVIAWVSWPDRPAWLMRSHSQPAQELGAPR